MCPEYNEKSERFEVTNSFDKPKSMRRISDISSSVYEEEVVEVEVVVGLNGKTMFLGLMSR